MICPRCGLPMQPMCFEDSGREGWFCDPSLRHCRLSMPVAEVFCDGTRSYPVSYQTGCGYYEWTTPPIRGNPHAPP